MKKKQATVNIDIQAEVIMDKKEIENLKVLLEEKEYKINILEETQSKSETTIPISNEKKKKKKKQKTKNEKQIQANSIKQKTRNACKKQNSTVL